MTIYYSQAWGFLNEDEAGSLRLPATCAIMAFACENKKGVCQTFVGTRLIILLGYDDLPLGSCFVGEAEAFAIHIHADRLGLVDSACKQGTAQVVEQQALQGTLHRTSTELRVKSS